MIHISLSTAIALYSAILGILVFAIWIYTEIVVRRAYYRHERQFLWHCVFCGYIYLDEEAGTLSQCPQCKSFNSSQEDPRARYLKPNRLRLTADSVEASGAPIRRNPSHRKHPHQRRRGPRRRR